MKRTGNRAGRLAQSLKLGTAIASALFVAAAPTAAEAMVQERTAAVRLDIPPQDLGSALATFARLTGQELLYSPELVAGRRSSRVSGRLSPRDGLRRLLAGSGIGFVASPGGAFLLSNAGMTQNGSASPGSGEGQAGGAAAGSGSAEEQEIVVTAQKREERLQDVPVPVTALESRALTESNQVRLQDYFARVPGLNFQAGSRGEPLVSIRGINSLQNPTVGVMVDDLPFGATIFRGGGNIAPDIDPSDLERIEVLRGPQGTLYGVSSLGGLIKYVTVDPSTDRLSGQLSAGIVAVDGGDDLGYILRGAINVPVTSTLAMRASAFTRVTPGYIDNPAANLEDVNRESSSGGRIAVLWRPLDALSVRLSALYQSRTTDGANQVTRSLGGLNQNYLVSSGWIERDIQSYTATINADLGSVEIVSLTGYNVNRFADSVDLSSAFGAIANANFGVRGAAYIEDYETRKFNQELRLSTSVGSLFDIFLGGFYTKEDFTNPIEIFAADTASGSLVSRFQFYDGRGSYEELAIFGDLTAHLTDRLDIQLGARQSQNRQSYSETDTGLLTAGGLLVIPRTVIEESPFTYLITPRYRFSRDLMVYARFASGYRAGGINLFFARGFPVPPGYRSDRTYNYEIGAKGNLFGRRLSFDLSLFHIDWRDLQIGFNFAPGVNYQSNGSGARSRGVELSLTARPWRGMTVAAAGSYNDAVLTEGFGSSTTLGREGDRLPFSSKFTGNLSIDQGFPIAGGWDGFVGATITYVGSRVGLFRPTAVRQIYPDYTQIDLRAGAESGPWRAAAFVTNLGNSRGIVGGGIGQTVPSLFTYIQPRTFGLSLSRSF